MPIKAYVWEPKGGNVGHASLELSDGTYISWWPADSQTKFGAKYNLTPPDLNVTLLSDIRNEEGQPDHTFVLPDELGLNEKKMKEWWERMKKDGKWNLLFNNCCNAVKRALNAGGLTVERSPVETPIGMTEYFEYLVKLTAYAGPRKQHKKTC